MKRNRLFLFCALASALTTVSAHSQVTVFSDEFENGNLDQWTGKFGGVHHGIIVADPLNPTNHVLSFSAVDFGGDIYSVPPVSVDPPAQHLKLSFDFLALPIAGIVPPEYGGFIGVATDTSGLTSYFMAGTFFPALNVPSDIAVVPATDSQWHHYEIDFTEFARSNSLTNLQVVMEDWFDRGSVAGDVYFDHVKLTAKLDPSVVAELVPCSGPLSGGVWKNHGAYVSAMSKVTAQLLSAGLITDEEREHYISVAARSDCGKVVKSKAGKKKLAR